jgi:hypothetical protein
MPKKKKRHEGSLCCGAVTSRQRTDLKSLHDYERRDNIDRRYNIIPIPFSIFHVAALLEISQQTNFFHPSYMCNLLVLMIPGEMCKLPSSSIYKRSVLQSALISPSLAQ